MKNLTRLEIKDLINRYQSELRKLEYQIQRTKRTIKELEEVVGEKDISSDLEGTEPPSKKKGGKAKTKRKTKKPSKAKKKKSKSPGRPPKHVIPGREGETRHGVQLSAWDQMIFDVVEDAGEALKTKSIIEGVKEEASKHDFDATKKYIRQKVSQSIHKLANKNKILSKIDAEGRGYAYAPKEWTNSQGNLKSQYKGKETKSTGKDTKSSKKKKSSGQKKSTGRRGRPPKHKAPKDIETETRNGYKLSAWDQMIFDVIEGAGEALKTKFILEGAKKWASEHDVDVSQKYLRQKVAASIHKLANKHKTLKKVDAEGRGYAYAPKEWVHSNGKLKAKYKGDKMKSTSASKSTKSSSKKKKKKSSGQKKSTDRRGRPPKYKAPKDIETETRNGYKLSAWDQMIFDVIEGAGEALKTKFILEGAKKWASEHDVDVSQKYLRQKVAASIHKLANKHKTLKKVDAEGRGYAYAPKEWVHSNGKLKAKYKGDKMKSTSTSKSTKSSSKKKKKKSSGRRGRPPKHKATTAGEPATRGGYNLSAWDQMIFDVVENAGEALKTKSIIEGVAKEASKHDIDATKKYIRQKVAASIHKLSNKHKTLKKVDAEGRGYAYAPREWINSQGKLKKKYQSEKVKSSSGSSKKSSGKKSSKQKESEGYRLSDWDKMVIQSIEKAGQALKNKEIFDYAEDWAKKEGKKADEKKIKQKISQSLHKLANKRERLIKVKAEGRGFAYAPSNWASNGNLKSQYKRS